jgi:hypothetical protein
MAGRRARGDHITRLVGTCLCVCLCLLAQGGRVELMVIWLFSHPAQPAHAPMHQCLCVESSTLTFCRMSRGEMQQNRVGSESFPNQQ